MGIQKRKEELVVKLGESRAARKRGSVGWPWLIAYVVKEAYRGLPPPPVSSNTNPV